MVKKSLLSAYFLAFFLCSPGYSSEYRQNLIQEIEDTFAQDILSSSEVSRKRKFYLKYPNKFEAGPAKLFLFHTNPEKTLKTIVKRSRESLETNPEKVDGAWLSRVRQRFRSGACLSRVRRRLAP